MDPPEKEQPSAMTLPPPNGQRTEKPLSRRRIPLESSSSAGEALGGHGATAGELRARQATVLEFNPRYGTRANARGFQRFGAVDGRIRLAACAFAILSVLDIFGIPAALAQTPPETTSCPAEGPLYALRAQTEAQWRRTLRLPRPPAWTREDRRRMTEGQYSETPKQWRVLLRGIGRVRGLPCSVAAVRAELFYIEEDEDGHREGVDATLEFGLVVDAHSNRIRVLAGEQRAAFLAGSRLDQYAMADADGDGYGEFFNRTRGAPNQMNCGFGAAGEDCECSLPGGQYIQVTFSGGTQADVPIFVEGRINDVAVDTAAHAASEEFQHQAEQASECPDYRPQWRSWALRSGPLLLAIDGGYAIDLLVNQRECLGWESSTDPCGPATSVWVRHVIRRGQVRTSERPAPAPTAVRASCGDQECRTTAVRWNYFDGRVAPHLVPVSLSSGERSVEGAITGTSEVGLEAGIYVVEVASGGQRLSYQVVVMPGDVAIELGSAR